MKAIVLGTTALVLSATFAMAAGHSVVRMGTEGAYPPYNFIDDNGEVAGFERELGDELCARAELKCEWVTNDWDSIIPNLLSGNYDTIIAGMSVTEERMEVIDFSEQYTQPDPSAYVTLSGFSGDLSGAVVAAQSSTIQASYIASSGATLLEFATPEETIAAVRSGEADAVLADKGYLEPIVSESSDMSFSGDDLYIGGGVGMGFRKSDAELREKFSTAIRDMKSDGTLNALISKWLPTSGLF
jgi:polar amino acid transport system substrate-binding protein